MFKIARDPAANWRVKHESLVSAAPAHAAGSGFASLYALFSRRVVDSFEYGAGDSEPARQQVNVLGHDREVASPDELYTLEHGYAAHSPGDWTRVMRHGFGVGC